MGVEVAYVDDGAGGTVGEVYVADKADYKVKVFDLSGTALREFGGFVKKEGWFNPTWVWQGMFVSLQSVAVDRLGRVHALDNYMNNVQIMDSHNTESPYLSSYGDRGTAPGQLLMALDIVISDTGKVIVANTDNRRVEVIYSIP
jgi:DNA-binding beta-propeller fold protein YncE